jgi:Na+/H+-dicarboxylate symporter
VPHSWRAAGPGLLLLLLPSPIMTWLSPGWIRPLLLGVVATGVALAGARHRKQAPLVIGVLVAVLDAGREVARAFLLLIHAVAGWIPIAVLGAVMLWAGATYEARLRNLRAIHGSLAAMS